MELALEPPLEFLVRPLLIVLLGLLLVLRPDLQLQHELRKLPLMGLPLDLPLVFLLRLLLIVLLGLLPLLVPEWPLQLLLALVVVLAPKLSLGLLLWPFLGSLLGPHLGLPPGLHVNLHLTLHLKPLGLDLQLPTQSHLVTVPTALKTALNLKQNCCHCSLPQNHRHHC